MTTEAKLDQWIIDGIEFEAKSQWDPDYTGKLPVGIVRDPNDGDLFFFTEASLERSELQQLVDDGYLVYFYPRVFGGRQRDHAANPNPCFALRLAVTDKQKFYLVKDNPEVGDCHLCQRLFPFTDNGDNVIMTHPGTGPSYSCGGTPPDYEPACDSCIEREAEGPDEEPDEEDLWRERGLI